MGKGTITPMAGTKTYSLLAAGRPCGVWVAGPATFRYVVSDRISQPVAQRNLKSGSKLRVDQTAEGLVVTEKIRSAVVWSWHLTGTEASDPSVTPPFSRWAVAILERPFFTPPSHDLLSADGLRIEGMAYALLEGERAELLLVVDPVDAREEILSKLDQSGARYDDDKGRAFLNELTAQPLGREWWQGFPAPLVATHEAIDLTNDGSRHVRVATRVRLIATRPKVGLWRTRLRSRTRDDEETFPVRVLSVAVNGTPAQYLHERGELLVRIEPPLQAKQSVEIDVVHEGEFAIRPENKSFWVLQGSWYPRSSLNGELATLDITVRVPEPLVPFAPGIEVSRETVKGVTTLSTRVDKATRAVAVVAGKYRVHTDEEGDYRASVAAYVFGQEKASRRLIKNFFVMSKFFGDFLGSPYPFKDLKIVEIADWGFGIAPPGMIFITQEAFSPLNSVTNRAYSEGVNERFVHEIAHGWWAHIVKYGSTEEQWLSESFAEYTAAIGLQAARGGKAGLKEFNRQLTIWKGQLADVGPGGSIYLANRLSGVKSKDWASRVALLYGKGPFVLHALRQELGVRLGSPKAGDDAFFGLLRSFIHNFEYRFGETRHLIGILDQMTEDNWQPWFDRYVFGTETPKLRR